MSGISDLLRLSDAFATTFEIFGADLMWLRVVVVAAAESEWDVGGRNVGARRSALYASAKGDVTA